MAKFYPEFSPFSHFSAFSLFKLLALFSQRVEIALSKLKKLFKTASAIDQICFLLSK
jgi:hypothetical protein